MSNATFTTDWLRNYEQHRHNQNRSKAIRSILEQPAGHEPLAQDQGQKGNPGRYIVRIESRRLRLLDEDNLAVKYHVDALRYAGVIPEDNAATCKIESFQTKVRTKAEEVTVIEVLKPRNQ